MTATANTQRYRARKHTAGLCIYGGCYLPHGTGLMCPGHAEADRIRSRAYYYQTKKKKEA